MKVTAGTPYPLGATPGEEGTNFALFSAHAERVELCLYDRQGVHEIARLELPEHSQDVWHGFVQGVEIGTCYGYRVHGPYDPSAGHRFNASKLLLDPYARALKGQFQWHPSQFGFVFRGETEGCDLRIDSRDNQDYMPKAMITEATGPVATPHVPKVPWHETVIYETHVKGFTQLHPDVPESLRGTFSGLCQPGVIDYIKSLGVTTVELLPVHAFIDEYHLYKKGLSNYWGYNTCNFFTPHGAYLGDGDPGSFRTMVDRLHDAGLEVLLDVVYNHTCEGDHIGPTLSFKGIDNRSYYRLLPGDHRFYVNDSGCGNTLDIRHPRVLQLVMDSLRYWVTVMGVDGFRFDLATILGRGEQGFSARSAIFQAISQDPVLSRVKLIAEPWDLGPGGYQLGHYPAGWSEWNDRYRDTVRRFWRGDKGVLPELARRLHGSGDLFEHAGRKPSASINFVTSHDGFTLRDLVSYKRRHNSANLENNHDGHRGNFSCNNGWEGPTESPQINAVRWRQMRNILVTLLVSQGVPMILAGDEIGRSQAGNNNAYCQDNPLNWIDWQDIESNGHQLNRMVSKLLAIRKGFPVLLADKYRHMPDDPVDDSIHWLNSDGVQMREEHWHEPDNRVLGYLLTDNTRCDSAEPQQLLVIFNAAPQQQRFVLPAGDANDWRVILDTAKPESSEPGWSQKAAKSLVLLEHSVVVVTTLQDSDFRCTFTSN